MRYIERPMGPGRCFLAAALLLCFLLADGSAELSTPSQSGDEMLADAASGVGSPRVGEWKQDMVLRGSDGWLRPTYYEILSLIRSISWRHGLDPAFVQAVIKVESDFDPYALSPKGARGLMQLLPSTAKLYGLRNYYDPAGNIDAGVRHLKMLFKKYNDDLDLVLAAYNAGPSAVDSYGGVPPYDETRGFVKKVKAIYRRLSSRASIVSRAGALSGSSALRQSLRADGTIVIRAVPDSR